MQVFLMAFFLPLLSATFGGIFSFVGKKLYVGIICSLLIFIGLVSSLCIFGDVANGQVYEILLKDFIKVGFMDLNFGFKVDAVSAVMLCVVYGVAFIVHVYSIGYMEHDESFNRFFSYLGLFVFCMLFLVLSDNFVGLFIGWEGVGLCSWLLIGFWYERFSANAAANEAFIMNRIGDLGLLLGMFLLFSQTHSLKFDDIFMLAPNLNPQILSISAALLFVGAMGKSAQFPLHTWLANAMEGPTPVSALIHAATMVTAGVYLVIRANEIYALTTEVSYFIACLGAFVAVFAASIALAHNDLKKIIAYSTLSQLGYMFVAAGLGAYWVALFHLATHAFFKSLLFLCAGNVMHAMHDELNIKKMGALWKVMKPTAILMAIGSVALAGFYPFAGFFSKDKILEVAFASGEFYIWLALLLGAVMTAFYSFRLIMLVFFVPEASQHHAHEAKNFMLIALVPLAIMAVIAGFFMGGFENFVYKILPKFELHLEHQTEILLIISTLCLVTLSTLFAIFAYKKQIFSPKVETLKIHKILANNYYIPQFYDKVCDSYAALSRGFRKIDEKIIDVCVDGVAKLINFIAINTNKMQSGNLSLMLRLMVAGFAALLSFVFLLTEF
ncbi:MAG: NADH-quinone oxidoreductase subunit L [Campylobacter sp.]|nr:NADH-quinone oxidoreductase subunit L [Campylobacter sp.]